MEARRLLFLLEKKEAFLAQVAEIDRELMGEINSVSEGKTSVGIGVGVSRPMPAFRRNGRLKEAIVGILKAAGPEGITVRDIATRVSRRTTHIHSWFNMTGQYIRGITKIERGRYGWNGKVATVYNPALTSNRPKRKRRTSGRPVKS